MKRVVVLGSTGSIGAQTLEVIEAFPDRLKVIGLAAGGGREETFVGQVARWRPAVAALADPEGARRASAATGRDVLGGPEGVKAAATWPEADIILNAMVGFRGLEPTLAALEAGKDVALANKESLVAGGALVTRAAQASGAALLPVDSEPSAVFQLLSGSGREALERIILTASGGPFYGWKAAELEAVTPAEALRHPTWRMGPRITVDSATMMNKGLEIIEASWFFGLAVERVEVLVHRRSCVHSLVELADGTVLAHLGPPDMRAPIQYALLYPERRPGPWPRLDLAEARELDLAPPDRETFPCLNLAYHAGRIGGSLPAVLNAADEVLVSAFLKGRIGFGDIPRLLGEIVSSHSPFGIQAYQDVVVADSAGRRAAELAVGRSGGTGEEGRR